MSFEKVFVLFSLIVFIALPTFMAIFIFISNNENLLFGLFLLLIEAPFAMGVISNIENTNLHFIVAIIGLLLAGVESFMFGSRYGTKNGIVSLLIYQWAWLAMYESGLQVSLKKIDSPELLGALAITFGSIATICWFWFSYIF